MNRAEALASLRSSAQWDIVVIGGGATGLGVALDAATRGYRTALLEAHDFAHGTSSRSTKLIHGGVRYLRSGQIGLVRRALHERTLLRRNAAELVSDLGFIIPAYGWLERAYYGTGLKLYDLLAGSAAMPSRILSRDEALAFAPTLETRGLRGGVLYYDAQFDDARLALALAMAATDAGAAVANYLRVESLQKSGGRITAVNVRDEESGDAFTLAARVVINATGVGCDEIRRLDNSAAPALLAPSQGAHLVLPARFLPGRHALMIPKTSDGRVLFAIPWHGRVLVGTTDTPVSGLDPEPRPLAGEVSYLLNHIARYMSPAPTAADVVSMYAGLRPLVNSPADRSSSRLSRDHLIDVSPAGLVTITGGKWTTSREMAEDTVTKAAALAGLPPQACRTATIELSTPQPNPATPAEAGLLHPNLPVTPAAVRLAARKEMARSVEDMLSRRSRALILDARASLEIAPAVARLMAAELKWNPEQERASLENYRTLAGRYLP